MFLSVLIQKKLRINFKTNITMLVYSTSYFDFHNVNNAYSGLMQKTIFKSTNLINTKQYSESVDEKTNYYFTI
jgi:hypothetical protein